MGNVAPRFPALMTAVRGEEMLQPEEVAAMMRLHALGWGAKRLSKEFGCARNTVRRYLTGLVGTDPIRARAPLAVPPPALLRPLAEYEAVAGGGW